jgi:tRNA threonylcarbamoyladenosine biosynthesis protein TsaE
VRGLLRGLGVRGTVRSPTYTLIEPYDAGSWRVLHYDLYRIADPGELELLGVRDHFQRGVLRCVEWPQRAGERWPGPDLGVRLAHRTQGRAVTLSAGSTFGEGWLGRLRVPGCS